MAKSPRKARRERTRNEILQTARKLIVRNGVDSLSLRELATEVEYSPAALYEYFENKEALLVEIAALCMEHLARNICAIPDDLDPMERVISISQAYLQYAAQHQEEFDLVFAHLRTDMPDLNASVNNENQTFTPLYQAVEAYLKTITEEIDHPHVMLYTFQLWSLMHGMAVLENGFLRNFNADFEGSHRDAVRGLLLGWQVLLTNP